MSHLGGVFSVIEDNRIHHINNKQNLRGAEIGGIKMHAAIDVVIRRNRIYNCTRGLWLDWQAQGTRVTQNLFFDNCLPGEYDLAEGTTVGEDIFVEVSHGPTLIDHNILLSDRAMRIAAQGIALVHNLIAGSFAAVGRGVTNGTVTKPAPRYTPYHVPHRTEIAEFMTILHGDMRFFNNIFIQKEIRPALKRILDAMPDNEWTDDNLITGTFPYEEYPDVEEYRKQFEGYCGMGSAPSDRYYNPLPVWAEGNVYFNGAKPMSKEKAYVDGKNRIYISVEKTDERLFLNTNLYDYMPGGRSRLITTEILGTAFEPEQDFENPDGSPAVLDEDYYGKKWGENLKAGPFEGTGRMKIG